MRQGYASSNNYTVYYYITNLQGDVIRLVDVNGSTAAYYKYDPYGNAIKASGSHANINPLRYRGYVYDTESGLYYLQSRYYDPKIGRFLNADALVSTGQGLLGNNMFAYCNNNPVTYADPEGKLPSGIINPNAMPYGENDSRYTTVWIHVTEYSNNPIINDACKDFAHNVSIFFDDVAKIIHAKSFDDIKKATIGILQNDITQDLKGVKRIRNGVNKMCEGITLIIVFPDPTLSEEVLGASKIALGFKDIITGIGEVLDWR